MISLITGKKGAGKTKKLIEEVNKAIVKTNGNIVVIEKGLKLTYDISHKARLIDTEQFSISGFDTFYGFICGICAGNYDVKEIFIDSTLKICGDDMNCFEEMINKIHKLANDTDTKFVISVSADDSEIPDNIKKIVNKI